MLETVMKHGIIFYVMGIMMAAGVLTKVISYITTKKLVRAASEIQKSNQRLMKLVKAKFEHASLVSDKVQNVEAFVQKYLYEYKVLGARLNSWRTFSIKMIWLIMTMGLLGVIISYNTSGLTEQTFQYGAFSAIYAVILTSIHILSDEKTKLAAAKNYMIEYLENVCIHRYEKANQIVRPLEEETPEETALEKTLSEEPERIEDIVEEPELQFSEEQQVSKQRDDQEMRLRAILEEFLA